MPIYTPYMADENGYQYWLNSDTNAPMPYGFQPPKEQQGFMQRSGQTTAWNDPNAQQIYKSQTETNPNNKGIAPWEDFSWVPGTAAVLSAGTLGNFGMIPGVSGSAASAAPGVATGSSMTSNLGNAVGGGAMDTAGFEGLPSDFGNPGFWETGSATTAGGDAITGGSGMSGGNTIGDPIAGGGASSGGFYNDILNGGTNYANTAATAGGMLRPNSLTGPSISPQLKSLFGNAAGAIFNNQAYKGVQDFYTKAADKLIQQGNPMDDPRRKYFQDQAQSLTSYKGLNDFLANDPEAQALQELDKRKLDATSAARGAGGTSFSEYLKNITNDMTSTIQPRLNSAITAGGYTMPNTGISAAGQMYQGAGNALNARNYLTGNLFGATTPPTGGTSGSAVMGGSQGSGNDLGKIANTIGSFFGF